MTNTEIVNGYIKILTEYYKENLNDFTLKLYVNIFSQYPKNKIENCIQYFILNSKYMPKISDINDYFNNKTNLKEKAETAWSLIITAIKEIGPYESWTIQDNIARKVLSDMGYENIINSIDKELQWKKKEFIDTYINLSYNQNILAPKYFSGVHENNNKHINKEIKLIEAEGIKTISPKQIEKYIKIDNKTPNLNLIEQ
jgi:hypothetical protein